MSERTKIRDLKATEKAALAPYVERRAQALQAARDAEQTIQRMLSLIDGVEPGRTQLDFDDMALYDLDNQGPEVVGSDT